MNNRTAKRKWQYAILLCVLVIGGITIGRSFESSSVVLKKGDVPPEFSLMGVDDKEYKLSDYKGKAIVINFWGTFCPPCVKEMPEFQRQSEKWKDEPFKILAINLSEDMIAVSNFVSRYNLDFTILRDQNRKIERLYKLKSYPTTFFVKPDGKIMDIFVGGMTEEDIDVRIRKLLGK
ncbi:thiol-disulfide oxidoreductase [Cohnella sp. CIP 111063]|uniref:redoxin domain-containing protein n=1 Tax=unclassified Cohnella TaxID=2636738 RepID=UPI000B8BF8EB|nr:MULTISPECIES: redoxin domain-containing protein [unclassified Cohnella]OXS54915.1 thiol-disulfide oxidoreductase [Cohnella sp. CIP 111063]PRX65064.1 peroxiredoxin [Cohnella sp. SGD-V74]